MLTGIILLIVVLILGLIAIIFNKNCDDPALKSICWMGLAALSVVMLILIYIMGSGQSAPLVSALKKDNIYTCKWVSQQETGGLYEAIIDHTPDEELIFVGVFPSELSDGLQAGKMYIYQENKLILFIPPSSGK